MNLRAPAVALHAGGAAFLMLVGYAAWEQRRAASPQSAGAATPRRAAAIEYKVEPAEWPGTRDPTYCQIVRRFELAPERVIATLQLNGASRRCANGSDTVARGQTILIALEPTQENACQPDIYICS